MSEKKYPAVGKTVCFWPSKLYSPALVIDGRQPCVGTSAYIVGSSGGRTLVNIFVVGHNGVTMFFNNIPLIDDLDLYPLGENYCEWPRE